MERIKLSDPGSELTLTVANVSKEEIGGDDYYKCDDGKTEIVVPASSVERQLERIGVASAGGIVGKTIRFSRSNAVNKWGKLYWNLDIAGKPTEAQKAAAKAKNAALPPLLQEHVEEEDRTIKAIQDGSYPEPALTSNGKVPMRAAYLALTKYVLKEIAPLYAEAGIGMSPESAAAATATLFIAANQRGHVE